MTAFFWSTLLITWNFRDTFISRVWGAHISRHLNFAILQEFCILNHFNFAVLSNTQFISLAILLQHNLEFKKPTLSKVKIDKNATAILYLKSKSLYFRDTHCPRHFNLAILLNREIREINVSRKFHVIRYFCYIKIYPLTRFLLLCYLFQLIVSPSCVSEPGETPIWEGRGCSSKNWILKQETTLGVARAFIGCLKDTT